LKIVEAPKEGKELGGFQLSTYLRDGYAFTRVRRIVKVKT